jgi:hypothetical protein
MIIKQVKLRVSGSFPNGIIFNDMRSCAPILGNNPDDCPCLQQILDPVANRFGKGVKIVTARARFARKKMRNSAGVMHGCPN